MRIKGILAAALTVAAAVSLSSCNSKSRLAKEIEGVWAGNPERIADRDAAYSTMIKTFEFQVDDSGTGGTVIITALIDVQNSVPQSPQLVQPIEVSAAATASVTGSWKAVDDDDVIITLDTATKQVKVDPDAVTLNYDVLDGDSAPDVTPLKSAAATVVDRQVNDAVTANILNINKIDDIKVHDKVTMECEINDRDLTLRRRPM